MKTPFRLLLLLAFASIALFAAAACGDDDDDDDTNGDDGGATVGDLEIMSPFSRGVLDRGAVFFTVVNNGEEADALIGADADLGGTVEIHETTMEDGQALMKPIAKLDIPANGEAELKPGGYHVMLLDLPEPLEVGQTFPVTLTFENAGTVEFDVEVESYSDTDPMEDGGGMAEESPTGGM